MLWRSGDFLISSQDLSTPFTPSLLGKHLGLITHIAFFCPLCSAMSWVASLSWLDSIMGKWRRNSIRMAQNLVNPGLARIKGVLRCQSAPAPSMRVDHRRPLYRLPRTRGLPKGVARPASRIASMTFRVPHRFWLAAWAAICLGFGPPESPSSEIGRSARNLR